MTNSNVVPYEKIEKSIKAWGSPHGTEHPHADTEMACCIVELVAGGLVEKFHLTREERDALGTLWHAFDYLWDSGLHLHD